MAARKERKMKKEIKVEWCENWIRKLFERIPVENVGIRSGLFWDMAEKSGLWIRGTYGSPMSKALENLTTVEAISNNGEFLYHVFRMKPEKALNR